MDILPYTVRYKAGSDKTIKPGIHGRFKTAAKAKLEQEKCSLFFGGGKRHESGAIVGRAVVGIVVDQAELAKAQVEEDVPDPLGAVSVDIEMTPTQALLAENARLKRKIEAMGEAVEEEDEELVEA